MFAFISNPLLWECDDNNDQAAEFLPLLGQSGTCKNLKHMCSNLIFFIEGYGSYGTVGDMCPKSCGLCSGILCKKKKEYS